MSRAAFWMRFSGALAVTLAVGAAAFAGPKLERIEPAEGPMAGGTKVVLHGSGFTAGDAVTFDGEAARDVRVVSDTRIEATTPAVKKGTTASVTVESKGGASSDLNDAFRFAGPYDWMRAPGLLLLLAFLIFIGAPLFLVLGSVALYCFVVYLEWPTGMPSSLDAAYALLSPFVDQIYKTITGNETLLAIPFFILSGELMTTGSISKKLVEFARASVGFLPGGMAIAAVGACMFFAAISGSSPVTVIAIGSIMFPALVKERYPENFSLGLVTSAGSLGILIPPSIPMIVYTIMVGGRFKVEDLFNAGVGPGLLIGGLLMGYSIFVAMRTPALRAGRKKPTFAEWRAGVSHAFVDGFWALMLPIVILGGIYGGLFTATAAGVVSVGYAYIVEVFIHRDVKNKQLPKILAEAALLMGSILVILAFAFAFNYFLSDRQIPNAAAEWLGSLNLGPFTFLLLLNGVLLVVGCLMDIMSAIMILAPLIAPMASQVGIDPIHLGIIFIVNLEIGYLTPPIGLNLFVACTLFGKPFGQVMRACLPFTLVMLVGLLVVTYVPTLSLGLGSIFDSTKPLYVPFPDGTPLPGYGKKKAAAPRTEATKAGDPKPVTPTPQTQGVGQTPGAAGPTGATGAVGPTGPAKAKSLRELMQDSKEGAGDADADDDDDKPTSPGGAPAPGAAPSTPTGSAPAPSAPPAKAKSLRELMQDSSDQSGGGDDD